jgi:serine phosphatase RsbU (regulator of sigma subunit)
MGVLGADVTGHGVPAALVASMVKLAFTTQSDHAAHPARVLTAMNRAVDRNVEGAFVTAVYAVLDSERRVITVANAGHFSVLVCRADGTEREGAQRGFMLGLTAAASYSKEEVPLRPGDRVLLYTDGLTETQNPRGEFVDGERLAAWMVSASGLDARGLADSLLSHLERWRGGPSFDDDVTFVAARVVDTGS